MTNYDNLNENTIYQLIVAAVQKAVSEDMPNHTFGANLETSNYKRLLRSDFINTNLRDNINAIADNRISLLRFDRRGFKQRLIVDKAFSRVFCIISEDTLTRLCAKSHDYPHYSQTFVNIMNKDLQGSGYQGYLFPEEFDDDEYKRDMQFLMESGVNLDVAQFHFYYIVFKSSDGMLTSIKQLLLDSQFTEVIEERKDLSEYIIAEYPLSQSSTDSSVNTEQHNEKTRSLVSLKPNVKNKETKIQKEA